MWWSLKPVIKKIQQKQTSQIALHLTLLHSAALLNVKSYDPEINTKWFNRLHSITMQQKSCYFAASPELFWCAIRKLPDEISETIQNACTGIYLKWQHLHQRRGSCSLSNVSQLCFFLILLACTYLTQKEFTSRWECPQGGILFMTSDMVNEGDD
jgi:hypothetical protein